MINAALRNDDYKQRNFKSNSSARLTEVCITWMQTLRAIYSIKVLDSDCGNAELLFTDRSQSSKIAVYVVRDRKKPESWAAKIDF